MLKYLFLIPVFNDWKSLNLLMQNIDKELSNFSRTGGVLVINDNSTEKPEINFNGLNNIKSIRLLNLNKNLGSQKSIAIGLKYLLKKNISCIITVMDSDGEDDPSKINEMINIAENNEDKIVTSNRTSRKENFLFKWLYVVHKFLTFIFSTHWISFGNFSSFHSGNLSKILRDNTTWLAFSSAISKNCKIIRLYAMRKQRYFGKSKVNFLSLVLHSFRVISVLQINVFFISLFYSFLLFFLFFLDENIFYLFLISLIVILNFILFLVKSKNNIKELDLWESLIKNIKKII